jgi:hypothetical protein
MVMKRRPDGWGERNYSKEEKDKEGVREVDKGSCSRSLLDMRGTEGQDQFGYSDLTWCILLLSL